MRDKLGREVTVGCVLQFEHVLVRVLRVGYTSAGIEESVTGCFLREDGSVGSPIRLSAECVRDLWTNRETT